MTHEGRSRSLKRPFGAPAPRLKRTWPPWPPPGWSLRTRYGASRTTDRGGGRGGEERPRGQKVTMSSRPSLPSSAAPCSAMSPRPCRGSGGVIRPRERHEFHVPHRGSCSEPIAVVTLLLIFFQRRYRIPATSGCRAPPGVRVAPRRDCPAPCVRSGRARVYVVCTCGCMRGDGAGCGGTTVCTGLHGLAMRVCSRAGRI